MNPLFHIAKRTFGFGSTSDPQICRLSQLLGLSPRETLQIPHNVELRYRRFSIRKRNGGRRRISAPSGKLKQLQRRLLRNYCSQLPVHHSAHAFRAGRSVASHARTHLGQQLVLSCDLKDFFPQTSAARVRAWFRNEGWSGESLQILMRLCVFENGLPQGAPTSPGLSNLVNVPLDERLSEVAGLNRATYSRYADDLVFSWSSAKEPRSFRSQVAGCLEHFGYEVQQIKGWKSQYCDDPPEITGVAIHKNKLQPARSILKRWHRWWQSTTPQQQAGRKGFENQLR